MQLLIVLIQHRLVKLQSHEIIITPYQEHYHCVLVIPVPVARKVIIVKI